MHRSGTSALAGAICSAGWTVGDDPNLLQPDDHNAKGYFERSDVVAANEELLAEASKSAFGAPLQRFSFALTQDFGGQAWLFGPFSLASQPYSPSLRIRESITKCVSAIEAGAVRTGTPFVLKDPRLCCTLKYWREFLPPARVIAIVRSPHAVAQSLNKIYGLPWEINAAAWAFYTYHALHDAEAVFLHQDLLSKPKITLRRVLQFLAPDSPSVEAGQFIDPALNHHSVAGDAPDDVFSKIYRLIAQGDVTAAKQYLRVLMDTWIIADGPAHAANAVVGGFDENAIAREILTRRLVRINSHPLLGKALLALRKLKDDPTFGAPL
jgi:hypothetical protein